MNYYQITPDIDFNDESSSSSSPSNPPTSDDDDDPNWLILNSSKMKHVSSSIKSTSNNGRPCIRSNGSKCPSNMGLSISDEGKTRLYRSSDGLGSGNEIMVVGRPINEDPAVKISNASKCRVRCAEINQMDRGNSRNVLTEASNEGKASSSILHINATNKDDLVNSNVTTNTSKSGNPFNKILVGVTSYAAQYINNAPKNDKNILNSPCSDNSNEYRKTDTGCYYEYADKNCNISHLPDLPDDVPPLVLCDLSPSEVHPQDVSINNRISELFDSVKAIPTADDTTLYNHEQAQRIFANSVVRRRPKPGQRCRGQKSVPSNFRKSFGGELVNISSRKLRTVSGYFGDWTKWLRAAEEDVNEAFYCQNGELEVEHCGYEINTNCEEGNVSSINSITTSHFLNNTTHQRRVSSRRKG